MEWSTFWRSSKFSTNLPKLSCGFKSANTIYNYNEKKWENLLASYSSCSLPKSLLYLLSSHCQVNFIFNTNLLRQPFIKIFQFHLLSSFVRSSVKSLHLNWGMGEPIALCAWIYNNHQASRKPCLCRWLPGDLCRWTSSASMTREVWESLVWHYLCRSVSLNSRHMDFD